MLEMHLSLWKVIHSQGISDQLKVLKKSDEESMSVFVIKVRALTNSLSAIENRLCNVDIIDFVANGLEPEF